MSIYLIVPFCGVTAVAFFFIGAVAQQHISYKRVKSVTHQDPYVYRSRHKLYSALRFLGVEAEPPQATPIAPGKRLSRKLVTAADEEGCSVVDKAMFWGRSRIRKVRDSTEPENRDEIENVNEIMKYGFPGMDDIHIYKNFVVSYDRRNRIAHWVCERLGVECLSERDPKTLVKPNEYITDYTIPAMFSPTMRDFRNSDWVGGHMASPQNYKCDYVRFHETYKFPNIVPIHRGLKTNIWQKLEHYVRLLTLRSDAVYVYTGPMFMPQRITFRNWAIRHHVMGMNTVAVPTHFFKVIISEQKGNFDLPFMEGYVVPNADIDKNMDLRAFLSEIRDIEHFAGLKFYDGRVRNELGMSIVDNPNMDYELNIE
ncbi:endonuclease G, mitochondrial isoform X1 [Drosophila bipectinata]|uniref:endonuclease G, mitochondrial isoform X1 n=2 Tax=Drosophila bipectinata TaxID=42026 RepID=UPI0007E75698|nr:endonuclease G, mitochondrial isoform X1 [Drosophila bipectinata]